MGVARQMQAIPGVLSFRAVRVRKLWVILAAVVGATACDGPEPTDVGGPGTGGEGDVGGGSGGLGGQTGADAAVDFGNPLGGDAGWESEALLLLDAEQELLETSECKFDATLRFEVSEARQCELRWAGAEAGGDPEDSRSAEGLDETVASGTTGPAIRHTFRLAGLFGGGLYRIQLRCFGEGVETVDFTVRHVLTPAIAVGQVCG